MEIISYGSRGPLVDAVQLALYRSGYFTDSLAIDGIFGVNTQNAVMHFQHFHGLVPDGIVGIKTWQALSSYIKGYITHTVVSGDSFHKIAARYGSTPAAIFIANPTVNPYELVIGSTLTVPFLFDVVSALIPVNSMLCAMYADGIIKRYPFVKKDVIGTSVLGRPILRLRIGSGNSKICYNASHHGSEWITTLAVLKYAEQLSKNYAYGRSPIATLDATLDVIPLVNPDGVDIVTGFLPKNSPAFQKAEKMAAHYPEIPFPNGWKANAEGVDLNLNYPASWETAREIKFAQGYVKPGPRDFVGDYPLSQPESRAMVNVTNKEGYVLTLSYHTQGKVIFWNYKDLGFPEIGKRLAEASGYALAETPFESANAGYKDWFIKTFNKPGYTIEAGLGVSPLPLSQFEEIYKANEPLMTEAIIQGTTK